MKLTHLARAIMRIAGGRILPVPAIGVAQPWQTLRPPLEIDCTVRPDGTIFFTTLKKGQTAIVQYDTYGPRLIKAFLPQA